MFGFWEMVRKENKRKEKTSKETYFLYNEKYKRK